MNAPTTATSLANPNALPDGWIDRLFERFSLMYGRQWTDTWVGIPMDKVKASWSEDLARFSGEAIRRAVDHCKAHNKFPPTCPEFVGLCAAFRTVEANPPKLSVRYAERDPKVMAEIAKWLEPKRKKDTKDWAREILQLEASGEFNNMHSIKVAKQALGVLPL